MTAARRLRLAGPIEHRDATGLLAVAAAMTAAKVPMSFLALLLLPAFVILVQGIRPHAPRPRLLRLLLATAWSCALVSIVVTTPASLVSTSANVVIMSAICLVATAIFTGGRVQRATDRLVDGLYWGLLLAWAVSMGEAVTGFKFLPVLYPSGNTAATVAHQRLFVSALFPNYNDYSVAMVMLCLCVVSMMLHQAAVGPWRRLGRWLVLTSSTFFIVHMGSRGALLTLVIGVVLLMIGSIRTLHPRVFGIRLAAVGSLLTVALGGALATSPYVQDHSTAERGSIASNIVHMMAHDPLHALVGWATLPNYLQDAQDQFGNILMDPHNVLLEIAVWYGLGSLLVYLACWTSIVRRGLVRRQENTDWRASVAVTVTVLMPLIGVVCSSTLRYHLLWLWLIAAFARVPPSRPSQ